MQIDDSRHCFYTVKRINSIWRIWRKTWWWLGKKWEICRVRQSGVCRDWRGRAAGGQVEIGQAQENYFVGTSLCLLWLWNPRHTSPPELAARPEDQFTNFSRLSVIKCPWILKRRITRNNHQELDLKCCKAKLAKTEVQSDTRQEKTENP